MNNNRRYCDKFNMTPQEFQSYKSWKITRVFLYIVAMLISTIFKDRWVGYIWLTGLLILSYGHDYKCEQQWIKDGAIKEEDLR